MKIAIPHWQSCVSPVCDEARHFLVVDLRDNQEVGRSELELTLPGTDLVGRADRLRSSGVEAVLCGAVSQTLETILQGLGIKVMAHVCGSVEDVLQAYRTGELDQDCFILPGCARRRRRRHRDGRCQRDSRS